MSRTVDDLGVPVQTRLVVLFLLLVQVILPEGVVVLNAVLDASVGERCLARHYRVKEGYWKWCQ